MTAPTRAHVRAIHRPAPATLEPQRVLAIDYGRKKIGLALSDELGITASPLAILERTNRRDDIRRLREICRANAVARLLVGHPLTLRGDAGDMAAEAARFAGRLKKELAIDVELVDERLTTWEAEQTVNRSKSLSRRTPKAIDHVAAAIFLREYLDRKRAQSSLAPAESA
ncbi:MAG TPA: Holliday junction resolvase RuvX [archaeon]|nr:Holliday junction resolvase RuvX [archaeon]